MAKANSQRAARVSRSIKINGQGPIDRNGETRPQLAVKTNEGGQVCWVGGT